MIIFCVDQIPFCACALDPIASSQSDVDFVFNQARKPITLPINLSGATQILNSDEAYNALRATLVQRTRLKDPTSSRAYGPCSRGTKRFKRITAQIAQEKLPLQALLALPIKTPREARV